MECTGSSKMNILLDAKYVGSTESVERTGSTSSPHPISLTAIAPEKTPPEPTSSYPRLPHLSVSGGAREVMRGRNG
jgi:hypothetical protein